MAAHRGGRASPDGLKLWRAVAETCRPMAGRAASEFAPPPDAPPPEAPLSLKPLSLKPLSVKTAAPPQPKPAASSKSAPRRAPPAPGDRSGEKRVRRGRVEIEATLDLHGMTQDQALRAIAGFLARASAENMAMVVIVTGKGGRLVAGEPSPGVLRQRVREWLSGPGLRPLVSSYSVAHRKHGGEGALYVWLRRGGA